MVSVAAVAFGAGLSIIASGALGASSSSALAQDVSAVEITPTQLSETVYFLEPVPALAGSIPRLELELAAPAPAPALMPPAAAAAPIIVDVTPTEGGGPAVGP